MRKERTRVPDVYAKAYLERVAGRGNLESALREASAFLDLLDRVPDMEVFLGAEHLGRRTRETALVQLLGGRISGDLLNLLRLMVRRRRGWYIRRALEAFREMAKERLGRTPAWVTSAIPLPDELRLRIERILEDMTGQDLDLDWEVDPDLLGGLRVRIGDTLLDASLRHGLRRIEALLVPRRAELPR